LTAIEPLTHEHFALLAQWLSNADINQWLMSDWRGRVIDPVVVGVAVRNKRNRFFLVRCDNEPCGMVALADWDAVDRIAMVWYLLGVPAFGRRGVMTDALRMLVRLAFQEFGIEALHAWIIEDNSRSRRVLERSGFQEAGRLRLATSRDGRRMDRVYFDLIARGGE
jgi:RimJ/RimL family protein N-acetyltransferase